VKRWMLAAVAAFAVGATLIVQQAMAGPADGEATGRSITLVKTSYGENNVGTFSGWTKVTSTSITVPDGTRAIIDVRFNAEGACENTGTAVSGVCLARVKIGNRVAYPQTATLVGEVTGGAGTTEGQWTIERSSKVLGPGTYPVLVQHAAAGDTDVYNGIYAWHLTVERIVA
jgi:hypothetical protein